MKKLYVFAIILMAFSHLLFGNEVAVHTVEDGETLSHIARKNLGYPIYSLQGTLAKIIQLNPQIKNPDFIRPGQKVNLHGLREVASEATVQTQNSTTQVVVQMPPTATAQPTPNPAPAAAPPIKEKVDSDIDHKFAFSLKFGQTTLDSTDNYTKGGAEFATSHDIEAGAAWKQKWNDTFISFANVKVRSLAFEPSTNSSKTILNAKQTHTRIGLGGEIHFSEWTRLTLEASYGKELFVHGLNVTELSIDAINIPRGTIAIEHDILNRGKTSMGLSGSASYLGSGSSDAYSVESGNAFSAGIYMLRRSRNDLKGEIGYFQRNQKSDFVDIKEKSIFGTLTFTVPIFEETAK